MKQSTTPTKSQKSTASEKRANRTRYKLTDWFARFARAQPSKDDLDRYVANYRDHSEFDKANEVKKISMLHTEVLLLLRYLTLRIRGPIVEFGAYVGGSTISLGNASSSKRKQPIISVEPGGAHNHPTIPTDDIFGDLERNLRAHDCRDKVHLINGFSYKDEVQQEIEEMLNGVPIGMLIIDSDGQVAGDIERYSHLLEDGCVFVLDDYSSKRAPEKETLIKKWVEEAEDRKLVTTLGVYGWGTWFGTYNKPR